MHTAHASRRRSPRTPVSLRLALFHLLSLSHALPSDRRLLTAQPSLRPGERHQTSQAGTGAVSRAVRRKAPGYGQSWPGSSRRQRQRPDPSLQDTDSGRTKPPHYLIDKSQTAPLAHEREPAGNRQPRGLAQDDAAADLWRYAELCPQGITESIVQVRSKVSGGGNPGVPRKEINFRKTERSFLAPLDPCHRASKDLEAVARRKANLVVCRSKARGSGARNAPQGIGAPAGIISIWVVIFR